VPEVSVLSLDYGDPYERRTDLERFMGSRGEPRLTDRLKARLFGKK
jgi:hypothetical protein